MLSAMSPGLQSHVRSASKLEDSSSFQKGTIPPMCVSEPSIIARVTWFLSHSSLSSRRRIPKINTPSLSTEYTSHLSTTMQASDLHLFLSSGWFSAELPVRLLLVINHSGELYDQGHHVVYILIDTITCIVVSLCPGVLERNNVLGISPKMLYVTNRFF